MEQIYRKPLPGMPSCPKCGNFIGLIIHKGFICNWCGYKKPQENADDHCVCHILGNLCPIHSWEIDDD